MKSSSFVGPINVPIFPSESGTLSGPGECGGDLLLGWRPFAWVATAQPGSVAQPASAAFFHMGVMAAPNDLAATDRQRDYSHGQLSSAGAGFVSSCGKRLG